MMHIVIICRPQHYERLSGYIKHVSTRISISPLISDWNAAMEYLQKAKLDGVLIDQNVSFYKNIVSMPIPSLVYQGQPQGFGSEVQEWLNSLNVSNNEAPPSRSSEAKSIARNETESEVPIVSEKALISENGIKVALVSTTKSIIEAVNRLSGISVVATLSDIQDAKIAENLNNADTILVEESVMNEETITIRELKMLQLIEEYKGSGRRLTFLLFERSSTSFMQKLVKKSFYDFLCTESLSLSDIERLIKVPKSLSEVANYIPKEELNQAPEKETIKANSSEVADDIDQNVKDKAHRLAETFVESANEKVKESVESTTSTIEIPDGTQNQTEFIKKVSIDTQEASVYTNVNVQNDLAADPTTNYENIEVMGKVIAEDILPDTDNETNTTSITDSARKFIKALGQKIYQHKEESNTNLNVPKDENDFEKGDDTQVNETSQDSDLSTGSSLVGKIQIKIKSISRPRSIRGERKELKDEQEVNVTLEKGTGEFPDSSTIKLGKKITDNTQSSIQFTVPHRVVLYSPKGGAGTTNIAVQLTQASIENNIGLAEIAFSYGQLAGRLNLKPQYNISDIEEGMEEMAVCNNRFLCAPWVFPVKKTFNESLLKEWLNRSQRAFPGRSIIADLQSQSSPVIIHTAIEWATRAVWVVQDTEQHLGMADIQISSLRKMGADVGKIGLVVQEVTGAKLPWSDVLGVQVIATLNRDLKSLKWKKELYDGIAEHLGLLAMV
ncbi:hypothetical protein MHB77_31870 [Paenibacillus sp. FSL K6-3166]|uniref:hypothetical protein n=1 Tax=Paenibacillus sp. FSL K6-3166 TaxID=2921492 RepID=UPI0030F4BB2B